MTTQVKCTRCGCLIDSTTVVVNYYKVDEIVDYGCPWCGPDMPLAAIETRLKKRAPIGKKEPFTVGEEPVDEP